MIGCNMQKFIMKPNIDMYPGIRVTKDTAFSYENENVKQTLDNLVFHSLTKVHGEGYESLHDTTIHLKEGDVLIFEDGGRGYIKPVYDFMTIAEAAEELLSIKDLG